MASEEQESLEPSVFSGIRRYWIVVLAFVLFGGAVGVGVTRVIHKLYQGRASIVITALAAPLTPNDIAAASTSSAASSVYFNQQITTLQSTSGLGEAADVVNKDLHLKGHAALTEAEIANNLTVTPPSTSSGNSSGSASGATGTSSTASTATVVQVNLRGPKIAAAAANAVISTYLQNWEAHLRGLAFASTSSLNFEINNLTSKLNTVTAQLATLQQQQASTAPTSSRGTSSLPTTAQEASLTTQQADLNGQISDLTKTSAEIQVNLQTDFAAGVVWVPALVNTKPVNDSLIRYGGVGLIAGLIVGVILSYVVALSRRRFEGRDDPMRFYGVPLLGEVPAFSKSVVESTKGEIGIPLETNALNLEAEAYRSIATSLRTIRDTEPSIVAVVTSSRPTAGKTTVVVNCGLALAEMGERVLLIDADPVKRVLSSVMSDGTATARAGLGDVLAGMPLERAVVPSSHGPDRLSILGPGDQALVLQRWRTNELAEVVAKASDLYDVILVDTPPMGEVSFATDLASVIGNVILVIPHHDRLRAQQRVQERLRLSEARLVGYIYNRSPRQKGANTYYSSYSRLPAAGMTPSSSSFAPNGKLREAARPSSST